MEKRITNHGILGRTPYSDMPREKVEPIWIAGRSVCSCVQMGTNAMSDPQQLQLRRKRGEEPLGRAQNVSDFFRVHGNVTIRKSPSLVQISVVNGSHMSYFLFFFQIPYMREKYLTKPL